MFFSKVYLDFIQFLGKPLLLWQQAVIPGGADEESRFEKTAKTSKFIRLFLSALYHAGHCPDDDLRYCPPCRNRKGNILPLFSEQGGRSEPTSGIQVFTAASAGRAGNH